MVEFSDADLLSARTFNDPDLMLPLLAGCLYSAHSG